MMRHTITLNGREYPLRISVNALCCLEEKTGKSLAQLHATQMSCLRGLLWCALLESDAPLTLEQAGKLLDDHLRSGGSMQQVSSVLAQALEDACFFQLPGKKEAAAPCGSNTTG